MKIVLKILRYTLYGIPLLIVLTVIIRLATLNDPPESRLILSTPAIEAAHQRLGGDFVANEIRVRNPFTRGDTFRVLDVVYLESSRDLQLTLRSKSNRFEDLRNLVGAPPAAGQFSEILRVYLRLMTRSIIEGGGIREEINDTQVFPVTDRYLFENNRYEYMRVNFSGVYLDYIYSRLDLFVFDNLREINHDDLDNSGYLGRVTLFDINMPRQRVSLGDLEILRR